MSLPVHNLIAQKTQLNAAFRVYDVINTGMERVKTASKCAVRSVYNRVHFQRGDVALPQNEAFITQQ